MKERNKSLDQLRLVQLAYSPGGNQNYLPGNEWMYFYAGDKRDEHLLDARLREGKHRLWFITPIIKRYQALNKILEKGKETYIVSGWLDRSPTNFDSWSPDVACYAAKRVSEFNLDLVIVTLNEQGVKDIQFGREVNTERTIQFLPKYQKIIKSLIKKEEEIDKQRMIEDFFKLTIEEQRKILEERL
jgi:hypothetical protein